MFSVALIGPDGSGKTTICGRLQGSLRFPVRYIYMGVNSEASNILLPTSRLRRRLKRSRRIAPDNAGPPDSRRAGRAPAGRGIGRVRVELRAFVWLANRLSEEWYRQMLTWYHRRRGRVVIFDRDFFADYHATDVARRSDSRLLARRLHGFLLRRFYRKPDLVILLDAPGSVLFARKGEGTVELLERRREEYRQLGRVMNGFRIVDATLPEDQVLDTVRNIIIGRRAGQPAVSNS